MVPSRRPPIVAYWIWPRPWPRSTIDSLRVSCQRAARPSRLATQATSTSGGDSPRFAPKEPPTSGTMTRTRSGSRPKIRASPSRTMWALWVVDHWVSRPSSQRATAPRPSIGQGASRLLTSRWETTTSHRST